ncbi:MULTISPECIES: tetraacyldisaccharide 4'-kinase [unclassified Campylobacter]|uniref:tetraacyldisaccharide 4'-kinase n=1 Tax=unclassified Campylobacter TaxID=2593542 RepID=UPI001237CBA1|nr:MULTISPECIES: tetraacyldisaccharide 4'-kinase [unclassified Campylobacter]KAA6224968.1 tetraacyldisaccharide 4'-kinase [Campylobacter sp. LR196d]KAA6225290.1 tetraacyldisaccharide 4'-kinase [Campylobacter sp. LR286c]KAA6225591.1 tetraacyldisaccharide 4'-kinase [Campylobacter sp. LR185c]KAA6230415.1 tetraacyldisaccharide 4'-kinase [Campylobacter sp. LR291e]KAA6230560.1 tetraacyldisaccharide 4'-kinase [Campylobacter sp. LR264d]
MTWLDSYFFNPNFFQKFIAFLCLPLSAIYAIIAILNTKFRKKISFFVPIISVGNLSFGGNGKTPLCKAIAREFKERKIFVILRGYKRKSKGLVVVKFEKILCNVEKSGDEAMEYAFEESILGVIVSEDRIKGIQKAIEMGANLILLDDAFSKFHIKKFDILLESEVKPYFNFVLPSGAYRLPLSFAKRADFIAKEGQDFYRYSSTKENTKAILVTAIAKPFRLNEHFSKARACYFFDDHYSFKKDELEILLKKHNCDTLMLTFKDFVKVKDFGFKCQIIELSIILSENFKEKLQNYIRSFNVAS